MITEQEAREAAARLSLDGFKQPEGRRPIQYKASDWLSLVEFARQELARREAERAERAKPITAELCKALGAVVTSPTFAFFRIPDGHNVNVYLDPIDPHVAYGSNSFPAVTTRGQLLDLLAALNGGA